MWLEYCPRCQRNRMYSVQRVRGMRNLPGGVIAVRLACYCGEPITVLTGRGLDQHVGSPASTAT